MNERDKIQLIDRALCGAVDTMVGGLPGLAQAVKDAGLVSTISWIYKSCKRKPFWSGLIERVSADLSSQDLKLLREQVSTFLEFLEHPGAKAIAARQREAAKRGQPISCAQIYAQWAREQVEQAGAKLDEAAQSLALRLTGTIGQEISQLSPKEAEIQSAHLVHLALSTDQITEQLKQIEIHLDNQARLPLTSPKPRSWNQGFSPIYGLEYSDRLSDFAGRVDELAAVRAFLDDDAPLAWWQISGEGGQGKSRLALKLVKDLELPWQAGFLFFDEVDTWRARLAVSELHEPTLIVIDYISGFPEKTRLLHSIVKRFSDPRWNRGHKLRLLIIDRDPLPSLETKESLRPNLNSTWLHVLDERQCDDLIAKMYSQCDPCLTLEPMKGETLFKIAQSWRKRVGLSPIPWETSEPFIATLNSDMGLRRPLFAMILALIFDADATAEEERESPAFMEELLHKAFALQQRQWGEGSNPNDQGADRLAVLATFCGRFELRQFHDLGIDPKFYGLTADCANNRARLTAAYKRLGRTVEAQVDKTDPPLEGLTPDILGEYFVLNWIEEQKAASLFDQSGIENIQALLVDCCKVNSVAALATLVRAWQDFRGSDRLRLALETLQEHWPALTSVGLIAASQAGLHTLLKVQVKRDEEINGHLLLIGAALGHIEVVQVMLKNGASPTWIHKSSGIFPLLIAAQNGHTDVVNALLRHGANPNQVEPRQGAFPLLIAAINGHVGVVKVLLDSKAKANQVNSRNGAFPLLMATQCGNSDLVHVLLDRSADSNQVNSKNGAFPLLVAAQEGYDNVVRALLDKNAEPNKIDPGQGVFPLLVAAEHGHVGSVKALLEKNAKPNQVNSKSGAFPLLIAAQNGHIDVVRPLLCKKADLDKVDPIYGYFPLLLASYHGHTEVVQALLDKNADPNQVNATNGATPLLVAAQNGHLEIVMALLSKGAELEKVDFRTGNTPLLTASQSGHFDVVQALLEKGSKPDEANLRTGVFPLLMASGGGHVEVAQTLLDQGADPNQVEPGTGAFPLLLASQNAHVELVKVLLNERANPDQVLTNHGVFPLLISAEKGHIDVVEVLLDKNAEPNMENTKNGTFSLLMASQNGHLNVVHALLNKNAEPNKINRRNGVFPLLMASQDGHVSVVHALLNNNAKPNMVNTRNGSFPLLVASENGHAEVVQALLDKNAEPNKVNAANGSFPLLVASLNGRFDAVRILLKNGADPNKIDPGQGGFPLLLAAESGHVDVVQVLLDKDADPNEVNPRNGTFPLLMACQNGHFDVALVLLDQGADPNQVESKTGAFPLLMASQGCHVAIIELLLARGAEAGAATYHGVTAINAAKQEGHQEVVDLLIAAGTKKT